MHCKPQIICEQKPRVVFGITRGMSWLPKPQLAIFSKCSNQVLVRMVHYSNYILFMNLGKNSDKQSELHHVDFNTMKLPKDTPTHPQFLPPQLNGVKISQYLLKYPSLKLIVSLTNTVIEHFIFPTDIANAKQKNYQPDMQAHPDFGLQYMKVATHLLSLKLPCCLSFCRNYQKTLPHSTTSSILLDSYIQHRY